MNLDEKLPAHSEVDVLVIGSGFGGSVMAARLAAAGRDVCVVERGKAYPPGSFPHDPAGMSKNFWDPSEGLHGMFNVWHFKQIDAVVSSGLGGGSLIYANVMLPKDESWFTQKPPCGCPDNETWTFDRAALNPHYERVRNFLDVQEIPHGADDLLNGFSLPKTQAFMEAAGPGAEYAPLAVRFHDASGQPAIGAPLPLLHQPPEPFPPDDPYANIFGLNTPRRTCRMLGECDIGCNEGAKNSLDHTYLSAAKHYGAKIYTRTEVRSITLRSDGLFDVAAVIHEASAEGNPRDKKGDDRPEVVVKARRVVLAAGTIGSTYLLLRDQMFQRAPDRTHLPIANGFALGQRFCGNGDLLGVILNAESQVDASRGPVITSYRRFADAIDGDPDRFGMYIEDAGYPTFLAWILQLRQAGDAVGSLALTWFGRLWDRIRNRVPDSDIGAEIGDLLADGTFAASVLPLLGMGRDTPDGELALEKGNWKRLTNSWALNSSWPFFAKMRARMQEITNVIGPEVGTFFAPTLDIIKKKPRIITVHPLGGCPTDTSHFEGVVDEYGRVRGVPGLRVCDGSVFPGPIGPNPSLTIAAFADRSADNLLEEDFQEPPTDAYGYNGDDPCGRQQAKRAEYNARIEDLLAFDDTSRVSHPAIDPDQN